MRVMGKFTKSKKLTESTKKGFTLVELSIALAFIGALLISIAMILINILAIYQKGLTLKSVDSVGRGLIDELTSAINTAPSVDTTSLCNSLANYDAESIAKCEKDHAFSYIFHASQNERGEQYNGIFCTGFYSYIWNTVYAENSGSNTLRLRYRDMSGNIITTDASRLMRVEDKNYRVCSAVMDANGKYDSIFSSDMIIDITSLARTGGTLPYYTNPPVEGMLEDFNTSKEMSDLGLALYEFTVFPISQDSVTLRTYMSGTFILATMRGGVDIMRSGDYCSPHMVDEITGEADDSGNILTLGAEFNYCAINKFNFAARTAGI